MFCCNARAAGLEPSIGFLHELANYQTKQSLIYDLQEPFRWIGDLTVLEAIESRLIDINDFYFKGDDYRYYFDIEAKGRFLEFLKEKFNSGIKYNRKNWKWDTLILNKTQELTRFLLRKNKLINFVEPTPNLKRIDNLEIRKRILELSQKQAKNLGVKKSTLHYLRKQAQEEKSFRLYQKVAKKLNQSF